jgi:hypothetical protein
MNRQEFTAFVPTANPSRTRRAAALGRPGRDIAALASVQILCFLVVARLEPRFFIIHLYQLIPYVAIVLLIGYRHERWAYMIGPLVSVVWLSLAYMAGLLGSAVERLRNFGSFSPDANSVGFLALATAVVAALMTLLCRFHWVKEYSGRGLVWRTFLYSLGIVMVYYGILLRWFWDMIPNA